MKSTYWIRESNESFTMVWVPIIIIPRPWYSYAVRRYVTIEFWSVYVQFSRHGTTHKCLSSESAFLPAHTFILFFFIYITLYGARVIVINLNVCSKVPEEYIFFFLFYSPFFFKGIFLNLRLLLKLPKFRTLNLVRWK